MLSHEDHYSRNPVYRAKSNLGASGIPYHHIIVLLSVISCLILGLRSVYRRSIVKCSPIALVDCKKVTLVIKPMIAADSVVAEAVDPDF